MKAAVIGCGESARNWMDYYRIGDWIHGHSIDEFTSYGVNDCYKWGYEIDNLIILDGPHKFAADRLDKIRSTPYGKLYTHSVVAWQGTQIRMTEFNPHSLRLKRDLIYKSKTSPFVAMSLAFSHGADEINLFGVDFNDHKNFKKGDKYGDREISQYAKFAELAAKEGVKIRVTKESALSQFIDTF